MKSAIIGFFTFEASFSLMFADDSAAKDDITYVAGHCYRCIACLNQVLFAKNETYCINEKRAVAMIESFPLKPDRYKERLDQAITLLSADAGQTKQALRLLREILAETESL